MVRGDVASVVPYRSPKYTSMQPIGICALCSKTARLDNSHIFSRVLFKVLRGPRNTFIGINGVGRYGGKPLQDGEKEHLFCRACEDFCNTNYEKPFRDMWLTKVPSPVPDPWPIGSDVSVVVDYAPFKLFHLLNLFRASVSSLPSFEDVDLGPHEEQIRKMLLTNSPGPSSVYPVAGSGIYDSKTGEIAPIVVSPQRHRDQGHTMYSQVYGGAMWMIVISENGGPATRRAAVSEDGRLTMTGYPWQALSVMHEARDLLASKQSRPQVNSKASLRPPL